MLGQGGLTAVQSVTSGEKLVQMRARSASFLHENSVQGHRIHCVYILQLLFNVEM